MGGGGGNKNNNTKLIAVAQTTKVEVRAMKILAMSWTPSDKHTKIARYINETMQKIRKTPPIHPAIHSMIDQVKQQAARSTTTPA